MINVQRKWRCWHWGFMARDIHKKVGLPLSPETIMKMSSVHHQVERNLTVNEFIRSADLHARKRELNRLKEDRDNEWSTATVR